ncbi:MAG: GatB/YqeY domain-containing protein [Candidatus Binatia bacterium]
MSLKQRIDADVKAAMLAGDRERADVLRGLKSAILYEEVARNQRTEGLNDEAIEKVIAREAKKRDEAAGLYEKGGSTASADKERAEKAIVSEYLPKQISDIELDAVVKDAVEEAGGDTHAGKIIGAVKQKVGNQADGARVASAVQKALT